MLAGARLEIHPVSGIPEVRPGDDLASLALAALRRLGLEPAPGDVLVFSSKVASKAMGLTAADRDAAIAAESVRVVAEREAPTGRTRVVESAAGPVMAAAGVDASNTGAAGGVLILPRDPDEVSRRLLAALVAATGVSRLGVVLSDTAGRPWRAGQVDFALGAAGLSVLDDLRGGVDADGRPLGVTARALADEIASAAELVKGKVERVPVALVRGLGDVVTGSAEEPGARLLVRTGPEDWFGLGTAEAVRSALGVPPGSAAAEEVGVPAAVPEPVAVRLGRAVGVALRGLESVGADVAGRDGEAGRAVVVTGPDLVEIGMAAARLCVALWGEGLAGAVERSPGDATAVTVRVTTRDSSQSRVTRLT